MDHFSPFEKRDIQVIGMSRSSGWRLKRYAIIAKNRALNENAIALATDAAFERLPPAGTLENSAGNHGVGFQIFHFSEQIPLVSPVFYWKWGSVLSNAHQMRSYDNSSYKIVDGAEDVVGCIWEMEIVTFEVQLWRDVVLGPNSGYAADIDRYLSVAFERQPKTD